MALTDPQSITVSGSAKSMPRILTEGSHSLYRSSDGNWSLDIRHRNIRRDKKLRIVTTESFTQKKIVADPLTTVNDYDTASFSTQCERPEVGFSIAELDAMRAGNSTWLDTAKFTQLLGGES